MNTGLKLDDLDEAAAENVNNYRLRFRAAIFSSAKSLNRDVRPPALRGDVLTAAQIGMMITSRMDSQRAAELADAIAHGIQSW